MPIQRLQAPHAPAYRSLMLEAYARHPDAFTSSVAERDHLPLSWWQARLSEQAQVLGAFVDGAQDSMLAGVAGLSFESREKTRHKATLFGMYVAADYRRHHLGRALVEAVLDAAEARAGIRLVQLTVTESNTAARALYERCGFVAFGVEPMAMSWEAGYVAKVHMWCELARRRERRSGSVT
jgi:ribosomal protein S18 acetylase RimI-like enzyme